MSGEGLQAQSQGIQEGRAGPGVLVKVINWGDRTTTPGLREANQVRTLRSKMNSESLIRGCKTSRIKRKS